MTAKKSHVTPDPKAKLFIEGHLFEHWTSLEVGLDLSNLAGIFRAELAMSFPIKAQEKPVLGAAIEIQIMNKPVLRGWIEAINSSGDANSLQLTISGRDKAGDIVDCTAQPEGPGRLDRVKLETVVGSLANPYGLSVRQVVDTGAPFEVVAFEAGSSVLDAIEKQSRQRGVLVTSDGLGGILLTKPGDTRADEDLIFPGGNVQRFEERLNQSFSDHIVKAQGKAAHRSGKSAFSTQKSAGTVALTKGHADHEQAAVCSFGYCYDSRVGRYRPKVYVAGSHNNKEQPPSQTGTDLASILEQSRSKPRAGWNNPPALTKTDTPPRSQNQPYGLNDQAAWRMRTTRAKSSARVYTVPRLLTEKKTLWRPNQLVRVKDSVNQIDGDMLIGAVTWSISGQSCETKISVVPPDAYDLSGIADHTPQHGQVTRRHGKAWHRHKSVAQK